MPLIKSFYLLGKQTGNLSSAGEVDKASDLSGVGEVDKARNSNGADVVDIEQADSYELCQMAERLGIDLHKFEVQE